MSGVWVERGVGVNILEDARHWIGLLQYNLSTLYTLIIRLGNTWQFANFGAKTIGERLTGGLPLGEHVDRVV